ncbi:MAG: sporulation protein YtfJ [Clostridia bacterium]|nr:sporulation protein YtfJ [Clostridia bacterium]
MENNANKVSDVIRSSLEGIRGMVDADTVIGTPINTPSDTVIIPISKVSIGFCGGGNDYAGKHSTVGKNNFGGGGGSGVTVTPVCFLVVNKFGEVSVLDVSSTQNPDVITSVKNIVDRIPDVVEKLKETFGKKTEDEATSAEDRE